MNLQAILAMPVAGNFSDDAPIFDAVESFVRSDAPVADRAAAVRHLSSVVMGLPVDDVSDADLLADFLED